MEKKIYSPHFGKEIEITTVLITLASQENCDGEPYEEMQAAAEYILELEERLKPYEEAERNLYERIKEIDKMHEDELSEEKADLLFIEKGKEAVTELVRNLGLVKEGSYKEALTLSYSYYREKCHICGHTELQDENTTITRCCVFCGQSYYSK